MRYIQSLFIAGRRVHQLVPLSSLFNKGIQPTIKANNPSVSYGQAFQAKKEEDFVIVKTNYQRIPGDGSSTYDAFAVSLQLPSPCIVYVWNQTMIYGHFWSYFNINTSKGFF